MRLGILVEHGADWFETFSMRVRDGYQTNMCGMCGDYNGNPDNDYTTGPRCDTVDAPGSIVSKILYENLRRHRLWSVLLDSTSGSKNQSITCGYLSIWTT